MPVEFAPRPSVGITPEAALAGQSVNQSMADVKEFSMQETGTLVADPCVSTPCKAPPCRGCKPCVSCNNCREVSAATSIDVPVAQAPSAK